MTLDANRLLNKNFPPVQQTYTTKDCMLYALGIGMGIDPLDEECLRFVFEENLKVMPSQSVMMAHPGFWAREDDTGLDWLKVLHLGQEIIMHRPFPSEGTVEAKTRITEVTDKGERIGALIVSDRVVRDVAAGEDICTLVTTILARGNGGFGGERKSTRRRISYPRLSQTLSATCLHCPNRRSSIACPVTSIHCMHRQMRLGQQGSKRQSYTGCAPWV